MDRVTKLAASVVLWRLVACSAGYVETEVEVQQGATLAEKEAIADSVVTQQLVLRLRNEIGRSMPHLAREVVGSIYVRWVTTIVQPVGGRGARSRTVVIAGMKRGVADDDAAAVLSYCSKVIGEELSNEALRAGLDDPPAK